MMPISLMTKGLLIIMGWSLIDTKTYDRLSKHDRSVVVFSHTTNADFWIFTLYMLSYPYHVHHLTTLIKPQAFKYFGYVLDTMGAIPSAKIEDRNAGVVDRIVGELEKYKKFILFLSPKGSCVKNQWRSGYYHIAKKSEANILVAGLDYEHMKVVVSKHISYKEEEPVVRTFLQNKLKNIVPLYPEEEVVQIRPHDPNMRRIIDIENAFLMTLYILAAYYYLSY